MRYVVDSSVGFKWPVIEPDTDKARQLRDAYCRGIHELIAPDVFPVEIAHALVRAERQGRITPSEGRSFLADVLATCPPLHTSVPLLPRAYSIASFERIGVYDCLYVALAEREQCELVTADERLIRVLQADFPFLVPLASLP